MVNDLVHVSSQQVAGVFETQHPQQSLVAERAVAVHVQAVQAVNGLCGGIEQQLKLLLPLFQFLPTLLGDFPDCLTFAHCIVHSKCVHVYAQTQRHVLLWRQRHSGALGGLPSGSLCGLQRLCFV